MNLEIINRPSLRHTPPVELVGRLCDLGLLVSEIFFRQERSEDATSEVNSSSKSETPEETK